MSKLTHLDPEGHARMVDVSEKDPTHREAVAAGRIRMSPELLARIRDASLPKGDVLAAARIAGIMAAKRTPDLIPLCHTVALSSIGVELRVQPEGVDIEARAFADDRTGVEMEALTAVSIAALTLYDMCKAVDHGMVIEDIRLLRKSGGRRGGP